MRACIRKQVVRIGDLGPFHYCASFQDTGPPEGPRESSMTRKNEMASVRSGGLGMFDDMGYPGDFSPGYGGLIGTAATAGGYAAAKALSRRSSGYSKHAWAVGATTGLVASAALLAWQHTRRAGMVSLANTLLLSAIAAVKDLVVEPKQLAGLYQPEMIHGDDRLEILGDDEDAMADALANAMLAGGGGGGMGAPAFEILGQGGPPMIGTTPMDVMGSNGFGLYQSEAIRGPYAGAF